MIAISFACNNHEENDLQQQAMKQERDLKAFAASYNAIADWKTDLPEHVVASTYSIQLEDALVRKDNRPIALMLTLQDIVRRDDKAFFEFQDYTDSLYLTLEASPEQVQQVLKDGPSEFREYKVVAEIHTVRKASLKLDANPDHEGGADIQADLPDIFQVRGRCIALVP